MSLREKSDKKPGGQKGHKGETLRQVAEPDATVDHFPPSCAQCGAALTPDMAEDARRASGVRSARAAAPRRHRTSGACLPVRHLRREDAGFVSRRRQRAGAIWREDRRLRDLSAALSIAAGGSPRRTDGRSLRREAGRRDDRQNEPELRRRFAGLCRNRARSGGGRAGQAHGRDRLSHRRQDAMAACGVAPPC